MHIDVNDPRYRNAAAEILRRHDDFQAEANITSAVRDFLILTGLARRTKRKKAGQHMVSRIHQAPQRARKPSSGDLGICI